MGICEPMLVLGESPGTDRAMPSGTVDVFCNDKSAGCDGGLCCIANPSFHLDGVFSKISLQHSMEYGAALAGQCFLGGDVFMVSLVI